MLAARDRLELRFNGRVQRFDLPDDTVLLDLLREAAGLSSVREGCGVGACDAGTVLLDGQPVSRCLVFAGGCGGRSIETVEALREDELDAVQRAVAEVRGEGVVG